MTQNVHAVEIIIVLISAAVWGIANSLYIISGQNISIFMELIMSFDPKVRVVTICDLNGEMMYSGHREGVKNLLTPKESKESLELAVKGWKTRGELAPKIGKGKYVLAEYEKVKRITIPLGNDHLLYITTEVECDHPALIAEIQKLRL